VRELVDHGMDVARINCAHDDPMAWTAMIENVRRAGGDAGRTCRVAMDLAGPKLRTGPLVDGPRVIKVRPTRDMRGHVVTPASCWLTAAEDPSPPPVPGTPTVTVPAAWLTRLQTTDSIRLHDARDSRRRFTVEAVEPGGVLASSTKTTYVRPGPSCTGVTGEVSRSATSRLCPGS
jgi:pyruvate kinase